MSSSANDEALGNFATDQVKEDQKYCAKIGHRATEARVRSLEKRIESVHNKGNVLAAIARVKVAIERKKQGDQESTWTAKLAESLRPLQPSSNEVKHHETYVKTLSKFNWDGSKFQAPPNLSDLLSALEDCSQRTKVEELQTKKKEKDDAKRLLGNRVQEHRNELCAEWGQHRVILQPRPTPEENRKGIDKYRRPHHRVVVQRDEEQIHNMIDDCVSKSVKKSLRKMRQNLFQRRINLAIHDRLINEWTLPKIRAEVRRRGGRGEDQHKAPRLTVAEAPEVAGVVPEEALK